MKQLQTVNQTLRRFQELEPPEILVLDIDSSNSPNLRGISMAVRINPHYGENGYHPIYV
ncbi:hypothetical protein [Lentibacillus sp. CBA3610]|uniref:hypothetical protein n=1 Tax=Lentibacillus sp. CBA3610 TaxID=2518176 RepID=UPI0015953DE3|nr:hypothetical protein [Lentibacillus sp. CBA3610]